MGEARRTHHRSAYAAIAPMGSLYPCYALCCLDRKTLAPRSTLRRHQSASSQPELISMVLSAVDPGPGRYGQFFFDWSRGSGNEANRHVAGIHVVVCDHHPLDHRLLIRACGHGRDGRARNLGGGATTRRRGERDTGSARGASDARRRTAETDHRIRSVCSLDRRTRRITGDARGRGAGRPRATCSGNDPNHCRPTRARLQSGHQAAGRQRSANQKAQRQQGGTARQAFEADRQRQGMRIAKHIYGSVATIESRIALPDQAISGLRPTAYHDIRGLH
jgi:hypothetical protein